MNGTRIGLAVVIAASIGVRVWTISERSLWFDEAFSFTLAHDYAGRELVERSAADFHPPLFYPLLRGWMAVAGDSVVALRTLPVVLAGLTLIAAYLFCRDALAPEARAGNGTADSRWTGVAAAALIGASSLHVKWSQEVRMYTLGTALVLFSTWLLVRALRATKGAVWWWAGFVICALAFAYTHNFALFSILGQAIYCAGALVHDRRANDHDVARRVAPCYVLSAFAVIGLGYAPWISVLTQQTERAENRFWTPPLDAWTIPNCLGGLVVPVNARLNDQATAVFATVAVAMVVVLLAWRPRKPDALLLAMTVMPFACAICVSLWKVPILISRWFLFSYVFMLCAVAHLLVRYAPRALGNVAIGLLVLNSLAVHADYWSSLDIGARPGIAGALGHVLEHRDADEDVLVFHPSIYFSAKYYLRGRIMPWLYVPAGAELHYMGAPGIKSGWVVDEQRLRYSPSGHVWVLDTTGFAQDYHRPQLPADWERESETEAAFPDVYYFQGNVTATRWRRRDSAGPDPVPDGGK